MECGCTDMAVYLLENGADVPPEVFIEIVKAGFE